MICEVEQHLERLTETSIPDQSRTIAQNDLIAAEDWDNWFSRHIDLQIYISPETSAEQIDQIFASMAKHIFSMKRTKRDANETN